MAKNPKRSNLPSRVRQLRMKIEGAEDALRSIRADELKAIEELIARVAHEIGNPVTVLREIVNLLLDGPLGPVNEGQKRLLGMGHKHLDRIAELIQNALNISRLGDGNLRLSRRALDLRRLLEDSLDGSRMVAGGRSLKLETSPVAPVFADPNRIEQVLSNLVSNAVKFTREDGSIVLGLREEAGRAAVWVRDDGLGIKSGDIPNLFRKFSQVGPRDLRSRGMGLGLAVCKEIVGLHGGTISVESEPARGSTFTFLLPFYTPELALSEGFKEVLDAARRGGKRNISCIVADARPLLGQASKPAAAPGNDLDRVAVLLRRNVDGGDVVLPLEPHLVAVLAAADEAGSRAMAGRLRVVLEQELAGRVPGELSAPLRFGTATATAASADGRALYAQAAASMAAAAEG